MDKNGIKYLLKESNFNPTSQSNKIVVGEKLSLGGEIVQEYSIEFKNWKSLQEYLNNKPKLYGIYNLIENRWEHDRHGRVFTIGSLNIAMAQCNACIREYTNGRDCYIGSRKVEKIMELREWG